MCGAYLNGSLFETQKRTLPECGSVKLSFPHPLSACPSPASAARPMNWRAGPGLVVQRPQKIGGQHERALYGGNRTCGVNGRTILSSHAQAQP